MANNHPAEWARKIAKTYYASATEFPELMNPNWGANLERAIAQALIKQRDETLEEACRVSCNGCALLGEPTLIDGIYQHEQKTKATNPYWFDCCCQNIYQLKSKQERV